MPEFNFTFEGTPTEIGMDASIKILAPVIEGVASKLPQGAHEPFIVGLLAGVTSMLTVNFGAHQTATLLSAWAASTKQAAADMEGPLQ